MVQFFPSKLLIYFLQNYMLSIMLFISVGKLLSVQSVFVFRLWRILNILQFVTSLLTYLSRILNLLSSVQYPHTVTRHFGH